MPGVRQAEERTLQGTQQVARRGYEGGRLQGDEVLNEAVR